MDVIINVIVIASADSKRRHSLGSVRYEYPSSFNYHNDFLTCNLLKFLLRTDESYDVKYHADNKNIRMSQILENPVGKE